MNAITIGIIDDHPLFREGVVRSLTELSGFSIVGEGASRDDARAIACEARPDVLLLDISMPGGGLAAIGEVLSTSPATRVLMLTASEDGDQLMSALQSGARGYILKGVGARSLGEAIRMVHGGARYVSPSMSAKILESTLGTPRESRTPLTSREREVIDLVSQGLSNKHIGLKLDLQEKTVKHHMTQIMAKLGVSNRTEAALTWRSLA